MTNTAPSSVAQDVWTSATDSVQGQNEHNIEEDPSVIRRQLPISLEGVSQITALGTMATPYRCS
eukprot:7537762-Prorocentrum_lima.AAC.1